MQDLYRATGTANYFAGLALASTFVCTSFGMAAMTLKAIHSIPTHFYQTLPVSTAHDFDGDGIPDSIDDSDGDGIPDSNDPVPYKDETMNYLIKRAKFVGSVVSP